MSAASEELRPPAAAERRFGSAVNRRVASIALVAPAVGAAVVWPEWVRFRDATPSIRDDWFAVTYSKPALHALLHGNYVGAGLDFAGRYRPAYTAIWNYAQWHLLGAPSMVTAAAWGVL